MMKKYGVIILSILTLVGLLGGVLFGIRAFDDSIRHYRSPLNGANLPPLPSTSPKTSKVVVVLVSGLGAEAATEMNLPTLDRLRRAGANAGIQSTPPTYAQTAWATLITGALPELNDAPPIDLPPADLGLLGVDTLFARAAAGGVNTALIGAADRQWPIPPEQIDYPFFIEGQGQEVDEVILEVALPLVENDEFPLVWIHFTQVNLVGQGGTSREEYTQAAQRIDTYLEEISRAMDLSRSVLIVLSDHGYLPDGGHGGVEPEVSRQPLVMIGEHITPGDYSDVSQADLAPTVTAMLGFPPPTATQGRILFEMLTLTEYDQALAQLILAEQRTLLAETYLGTIVGPPTALPAALLDDLEQAQQSFAGENYSGAFRLAALAQQEADAAMAAARSRQIWAEQLPRLVVTLLLVLIWPTLMWRLRGTHVAAIVVATILTIALYHILYQLQGYNYSLSSLRDFAALPFDTARRVAVSLLAGWGLMLIVLIIPNEDDWATLLGAGYGFSMLVTFIFALPLLWVLWQNGFGAGWRLPDVDLAFWQIIGLLEVGVASVLGLLLPWPVMTLSLFVNLVRRQLNQAPRGGTDILPGLHFK
jgi:hypothetical protein